MAKATPTPSGQVVHTYSAVEETDGRSQARQLAARKDGMPNLRVAGNHATCSDGLQILFCSSTCGVTMHGPRTTDHGPETDPTSILWDQPQLSLTTPLGITLRSAVRAAWSHRCMVKVNARVVHPLWDQFLTLWITVLRGWEEHPTPSQPAGEISLLVHALQSIKDHTVLQHPRVAVSNTHSPRKLYLPARKRKKKFENAEALAAQYEATIQTYREQGWDIIYPEGSSEKHPEVGWVGGYGVFFGDHRDTAEYIPLGEEQTNNRGELQAVLRSLQGHREGHQSLIYPDSLPVVNGVLGWAQRWRRHRWQNKSRAMAHVDLWTHILHPVDKLGEAIKWLYTPSHIGIKGNGRADHLADAGRRRSPSFLGSSPSPPPPPPLTSQQPPGVVQNWSTLQCSKQTLNNVVMTMRL